MNKKILIVEDEPLLLKLYAKKLSDAGFEVETAIDGQAGYEKARDWQPDLVLLDILMPKVDGYGMLRLMRKEETTKYIPAMIVTNSPSLPDTWEAKTMRVVKSFFKTDVTPSELAAYIQDYFRKEERG